MQFKREMSPRAGKCQEFCQTEFPGQKWTKTPREPEEKDVFLAAKQHAPG